MNDLAVWIEDMLGAIKEDSSQDTIKLIESCGKGCASRHGAMENIKRLKENASHCKTRSDFVEFLREQLPRNIIETDDGFIEHFNIDECICPMASEISKNTDALCNCTIGHEKAFWSEFFNKHIDVEIVETISRGGDDCVFKIIL